MPIEQPAITWKGAHAENYQSGRGGYALEFLVLHIMEGSLDGCAAWFNDPAARASTHYGVGKDGRIFQFVKLADMPFAHGSVEVAQADAPAVLRVNWGVNPNNLGVGIEHEGFSGEALTPAQFEASARLAAWLFVTVLLPGGASDVAIDRAHILRHGEISPRTRSRCPGFPEETFSRYIARVQELARGSATVSTPRAGVPSLKAYQDALTMQAAALDELAARATVQAANLRALLRSA